MKFATDYNAKDCSQPQGGINIYKNDCTNILAGNASHQLKYSTQIFQQLGAISKLNMSEE